MAQESTFDDSRRIKNGSIATSKNNRNASVILAVENIEDEIFEGESFCLLGLRAGLPSVKV